MFLRTLVNKTTRQKVTAKQEKLTFLVKTIPTKKHNLRRKVGWRCSIEHWHTNPKFTAVRFKISQQ